MVPLKSRKAEAILLCLALSDERGFEREYLSRLLWPDLPSSKAKASLRQALARLRRVFGDVLLSPKPGWISLSKRTVVCDLWRLKQNSRLVDGGDGIKVWPTEPFLLNFPEPTNEFSEWIEMAKRECREQLKMAAIRNLSDPEYPANSKDGVAQTLLLLDHLDEECVSAVLVYLRVAGSDRRFLAVRNSYTSKLNAELGLTPSDEFLKRFAGTKTRGVPPHSFDGKLTPDRTPQCKGAEFDKPILTVSNFDVVGTNDDLSYLGLGFTEEIIMLLSNQNWFEVNKGDAKLFYSPPKVGSRRPEHLTNAYSVSGTIATSTRNLRISVKLVGELEEKVKWSRSYQCSIDDFFDLQQDIVASISEVLTSKVLSAEATTANQLDSEFSKDIWVRTMKARYLFWKMGKKNNAEARALLDDVIDRSDPPSVPAFVLSTFIRLMDVWSLWSSAPKKDVETAVMLSERSVRVYPDDPWTYFSLATALGLVDRLDQAIETYARALTFNPNFAPAIGAKGKYQVFSGDIDQAKKSLKTAIKLNDMDTHYGLWQNAVGIAHYLEGDFDQAQVWADRAISTNSFWAHNYLLSAANQLAKGNSTKAKEAYSFAEKFLPEMTAENLHFSFPFQSAPLKTAFFDPLHELGLPKS